MTAIRKHAQRLPEKLRNNFAEKLANGCIVTFHNAPVWLRGELGEDSPFRARASHAYCLNTWLHLRILRREDPYRHHPALLRLADSLVLVVVIKPLFRSGSSG